MSTEVEESENDLKAQQSPTFKPFMESLQITMRNGFDWVADDYSYYLTPWGFDPRDISCPVEIWQGGLDVNVPPQHGRWLAEHIPSGNLHFGPDESHIGLFINYEEEISDSAKNLLLQ